MPLYEYQCEICSNIDESIEKIHTEEIECSLCNSKSKRIISLSNFELKGRVGIRMDILQVHQKIQRNKHRNKS